jgi:hypothetical protein
MKSIALFLMALPLLVACSKAAVDSLDESKKLVRVGDLYITQFELDYQVNKLTGLKELSAEQDSIKKNVLESLVLSKLMAQKQMLSLTTDEQLQLDLEVKLYREDRLTQAYLSSRVTPVPPSSKQVEDFYSANLHRFGGGEYANVEYWTLTKDCKLQQKKNTSNKQLKNNLLDAGCNQSQNIETELLAQFSKKVGAIKDSVSPNKAYWLSVNGTQKIAFVNNIVKRDAKPLVEVAASIRKMLAPMQLRTAIADTKSQLIKEMEIEYFD